MALPLYVSSSIQTGTNVASLTVPYPLNEIVAAGSPYPANSPPQSGQSSWLFVTYRKEDNTSIAAPTVSGWTAAITPSTGTGVHLGVYYRQGDGTAGGAIVTWPSQVICAATIALIDRSATVSPVATNFPATASTGPNGLGTHTISSVTTTENDVLVLGCWYGPGDDGYWAQFDLIIGYYYGVAGNMEQISTISSDPTFTPPEGKSFGFPTGVLGVAQSLNYELRPTAGAIGARQAQSLFNSGTGPFADSGAVGLIALVGVKPFTGPSRPTITAPVTGEVITNTRTYAVTWTPSTDPVIAQASLTYNLDYTLNDGFTWVQLDDFTAAGATSFNWTPTGLTGTQVKIRLRAHNGTEYGAYYTTGRFTLAADATPNAPTALHGEQPDGTTVSLFDTNSDLIVKGVFSDPGDVMTGFQLDWGTDGVTYGNTSTNNTSIFSKTYDNTPTPVFSPGTIYFRCRTKDTAAVYGPYAYFTLQAAAAPAAPNITSPTAAAPPTSGNWTITYTGPGTKYQFRIEEGGVIKHNSAFIVSSATSFPSPYIFETGHTYTLYLRVQAASGLNSAYDSESFTALYTGPAAPSIAVT